MSSPDAPIELSRQRDPAAESAVPEPAAASGDAAELVKMRISPETLLEKRRTAQQAYVFDLRDVDSFRDGHLPGAYSLPFDFLESNLHRLPFSGELMFYDGGEGTAQQAAKLLHDNGFTDQTYVEEGYEALKKVLANAPGEVQYDKLSPEERRKAIEIVLDEKIREFLARDGGGLEVKSIEEDRVLVEYFGACGGCGSSTAGTLRFIQGTLTIALNHEIEVVPMGEGMQE